MSKNKIGQLIKKLRIAHSLTQKELADKLFVTDKAVSKWERGLSLPDSSLLFKLSIIFNCDVDDFVECNQSENKWTGILILDDHKQLDTIINGVPLFELMLGYFLLVNIFDIEIRKTNCIEIDVGKYHKYGLNLSLNPITHKKVFIIKNCFFLFGTSVTKMLRNCMNTNINTILVDNNGDLPFAFSFDGYSSFNASTYQKKKIWRGMIGIPLDSNENISNADEFIKIYETYTKNRVMNLEDIYNNRH